MVLEINLFLHNTNLRLFLNNQKKGNSSHVTETESKAGKVIAYAPTEKAFVYIDSVPDALAKPDLTAWFEGRLEEMAKGALEYAKYREILNKLVNKSIESAKDGSALSRMVKVQAVSSPSEVKSPKKRSTSKKPKS